MERPSRRARIGLALWIGLTLFVVVPWYRLQDHPHWGRILWFPLASPWRLRDIIANTLFYIPFGLLWSRAVDPRVSRVVLAGCLLSLLTEFSQVFSHGRFPSTTDLVCNTVGAWWGAVWAQARLRRS